VLPHRAALTDDPDAPRRPRVCSPPVAQPDDHDGAERRRRAQGPRSEELRAALAGLDPELAEWVDSFVFDQVWGRPGLSEPERMLVAISALAALGRPDQLRAYLFGALHAGVPAVKIHETLVMQAVYAGFPAAIGALSTWREVVASARRQGLDVELPGDV
jgi:4-carboxymuconolactone decarboxylase